MIEIAGKPINCTDCVFKSKLPGNEPFCKKTGELIFQIETCTTGPLMPVEKVRQIMIQARRRGRHLDMPLDQNNFYAFRVKRACDNVF